MKSIMHKVWFVALLLSSVAPPAVSAQKVLTFDALPSGAAFSSYTEDGITFASGGGSSVFLTASNSQNSTTAIEITSSNFLPGVYSISMGGRYFSLRSFNVVVPASGVSGVRSAFGSRSITNGTTGLVTLSAGFENVTYVRFELPSPQSRLTLDNLTIVPVEPSDFVNWETAPVHPISLSSDGQRLAVCNLSDNRLELFDVAGSTPVSIGNVAVGLDPVSARWRTSNEVWVVNYISDSVSVVDASARKIVATLNTLDTPADVVFAGSPQRAFVSCSMPNTIQVFDPVARISTAQVAIDGERPKAMAASPDGSKVYVAIFESGNASTVLGAAITNQIGPSVVNYSNGPYGGRNPPPNRGTNFSPAINPDIPTNFPPPKVSHIVKKNAAGRWMDDNNGDWTEFVSGTNAALSGRRVGWDLPDHDLAIIDTTNLSVRYATRLMNICMDLAVNPGSGQIAVVGTDASNEIRFEPNLNGTFVRVELALVDPSTLTSTNKDLNPHLNYVTATAAESERNKSIGDPRGIVWNSSGTRGYVAGMGSSNLVIIDASGDRVGAMPLNLGEGPTGLALDEARHRLYVLNRLSASISVVDTLSETVVATTALFDPTPSVIKTGRKHLYDTHKTSGLGQAACASCHVDARMDRLAWDLGNPAGSIVHVTNSAVFDFHPMKGPMVTITFEDIIGHEPFHWRGDRANLQEFNQTFTNLQGAATALTTNELKEFKDFLATIHFPPNPFRHFDNSLATNVPLPGHHAIGQGVLPKGAQLPNGNAFAGMTRVALPTVGGCLTCHTFPSGLSRDFPAGLGQDASVLPAGPDGEHHLELILRGRLGTPLKASQLRGLFEKTGLDFDSTASRAGFGFTHHGNADTLTRFLQSAFAISDDQETANVIAFLISISGSDLPLGTDETGKGQPGAVGPPSKDVPAAVGKQVTIDSSIPVPRIDEMLSLANSPTSRVELIVRGVKDGLPRGWLYLPGIGRFQSDRLAETISPQDLRALATVGNELTYTIVPEGMGRRLGLDRDRDGFFDRDELDLQSDPADSSSIPVQTYATISINSNLATISWNSLSGKIYQVQFKNDLGLQAWSDLQSTITASNGASSITENTMTNFLQRFYRIKVLK
jgi:YVTN family beta-propeller protein